MQIWQTEANLTDRRGSSSQCVDRTNGCEDYEEQARENQELADDWKQEIGKIILLHVITSNNQSEWLHLVCNGGEELTIKSGDSYWKG